LIASDAHQVRDDTIRPMNPLRGSMLNRERAGIAQAPYGAGRLDRCAGAQARIVDLRCSGFSAGSVFLFFAC
jgi:hypothetical protein